MGEYPNYNTVRLPLYPRLYTSSSGVGLVFFFFLLLRGGGCESSRSLAVELVSRSRSVRGVRPFLGVGLLFSVDWSDSVEAAS